MSWSKGCYAVMLEVMSDQEVPGLAANHPHERIDTTITATVDHADGPRQRQLVKRPTAWVITERRCDLC